MATTIQQQALEHPLVTYNYRVIVAGITMRFSSVEGLRWERSTITYRDGLSFLEGEMMSAYSLDRYTPVTLQQGLIAHDTSLLNWVRQGDARTLEVFLCKPAGQPIISWKANRAIPVRLTPSLLVASSNDVVIDTLELQACGWSVNHPL